VARWTFICLALLATRALPAAEVLLIKAAAVHTVSGQTLEPGEVLVRDGLIADVGSNLEAAGAQVIDLGPHQLFPGVIAADTVLGLVEIGAVRASVDMTEVGAFTPDVRSWVAVNPDSELIPVARANGITHFQPVPLGGIIRGQSGVLATAGWTTEDMTVRAGVGLHMTWPDQSLDTTPKSAARNPANWKSLEDQAKARRAEIKAIDDFFDEAETFARSIPETTATPIPAWEAMIPSVTGKMPIFIQADEAREIRSALEWAGRRNYRMILTGGRDAWQLAEELGKAGVPVVYDHVFTLPRQDAADYDVHYKTPALLHQHGVKVIFSQTPGMEGADARNLPYEAAQAVAFGLPPLEGVRGITLYPAQILGLEDRLGSIEKGKEASLIALDGHLLDIRARVRHMWIAGREVSLESRHTRLYEKYRARPKP